MTFVNTMIVQGKSIKDRVKVREDFMVERITDILAVRSFAVLSILFQLLICILLVRNLNQRM